MKSFKSLFGFGANPNPNFKNDPNKGFDFKDPVQMLLPKSSIQTHQKCLAKDSLRTESPKLGPGLPDQFHIPLQAQAKTMGANRFIINPEARPPCIRCSAEV